MSPLTRRATASLAAWVARTRNAPALHPHGVVFTGEVSIDSDAALPFTIGTQPVIARLSKAAGTPGGAPDVLGLAVRLVEQRWDLTLATCAGHRLGRVLPLPARSWSRARLSSITPYRWRERRVWLFATPEVPVTDTAVDELTEHVPIRILLGCAGPRQRPEVVGLVTLDTPVPRPHLSFDPLATLPAGVDLVPQWIKRMRQITYPASRRGRRVTARTER